MDPDELLRAALLADATFPGLIGGAGDAARLYYDEPPTWSTLALVLIHEIPSDSFNLTLDGPTPLSQWWRQIDCYASTPAGAKAIRKRLLATDGPLWTLVDPPLQAAIRRTYAGKEAIKGPNPDDRATTLYRASLDLQLWLSESD